MNLRLGRGLLSVALLSSTTISALPIGDASKAPVSVARDNIECTGSCAKQLVLNQTAYSACSSGVEYVMSTYNSLGWCAQDNNTWCKDTVGSYVAALASKAAVASSPSDYGRCGDACMLSALDQGSRTGALWCIRWAEGTFNVTGDADDRDVVKLHWTEWTLSQSAAAVDPAALRKAIQSGDRPLQSMDVPDETGDSVNASALAIPPFTSSSKLLGPYVDPASHGSHHHKHLAALLGAAPAVLGGTNFLTWLLASSTRRPGSGPTYPTWTVQPGCGGGPPIQPGTQSPPQGWTLPDPPLPPLPPSHPDVSGPLVPPEVPEPGPISPPGGPGWTPPEISSPPPSPNIPEPMIPPQIPESGHASPPDTPGTPPVEPDKPQEHPHSPGKPQTPPPEQLDPGTPEVPSQKPDTPPKKPDSPQAPDHSSPGPEPIPTEPDLPSQKPNLPPPAEEPAHPAKPPSPPSPPPPEVKKPAPEPEPKPEPKLEPSQPKAGTFYRAPNGARLKFAPRHRSDRWSDNAATRERVSRFVQDDLNPFDVLDQLNRPTGDIVWHRWGEVARVPADWNQETQDKTFDGDDKTVEPQPGPSGQKPRLHLPPKSEWPPTQPASPAARPEVHLPDKVDWPEAQPTVANPFADYPTAPVEFKMPSGYPG